MTPTGVRPTWLPPEWGNWSLPDPKVVDEQLKSEFTDEERAKAWDNAAKAVKAYHDELVEQWQKAMDSLLVYAGLFSAVLTAFNVQSYQLLQSGPTDPMIAVLQQISTQLNSFSVNPSFINSTQPASSLDQLQPPFRVPVSAVWINTLWFASLVCSLASASIALIVKQWLYEESKGLSGTSRETARLRQYQLNSLVKWKVGVIILVPSVLLQVALFLFLSGLLVLLWTIHETVAAVISALVGALFVFVVTVTLLPLFSLDCCYRSPQAFGIHVAAEILWNRPIQLATAGFRSLWFAIPVSRGRLAGWCEDLARACWHLGRVIPRIPTWNGAEQMEIARDNGLLDRHIATTAYTTTFATEHLEALHILLFDLPCDQILSCFSDIHRSWAQLWGSDEVDNCSARLKKVLCGRPFYHALRKLLTVDPGERNHAYGNDWMELSSRYLLSSYDAAESLPCSGEFLSTLALTSIGDHTIAKKACNLLVLGILHLDEPFSMTYNVLRDVMAVARYYVEHWDAPVPDDDALWHKLWTIAASFRCTLWVLINNSDLSSEQERWICDETRSLLYSLTEKIATTDMTAQHVTFASCVLEPLIRACRAVSRGYDLVPERFLLAAQQVSQPGEASQDDWRRQYANDTINVLKSAIRQKKHDERHSKRCFHAQQPPAVVF